MGPYSHLVIAAKLEERFKPDNPQEYYWGAIAPDIRYLVSLPRSQTHLSTPRIIELAGRFPSRKSFLQGYLVHCLSDEIHIKRIFFRHIPFSILKSILNQHHLTVLLELFYFEAVRTNWQFSGTTNEIFHSLGISEADTATFAQSVDRYVSSASPESRIADLCQMVGLADDSRVKRYRTIITGFQRNWMLKNALFTRIRSAKISEEIVLAASALLTVSETPSDGRTLRDDLVQPGRSKADRAG